MNPSLAVMMFAFVLVACTPVAPGSDVTVNTSENESLPVNQSVQTLPASFTFTLSWDGSSSGGSRSVDGMYVFDGDVLVAGNISQFHSNMESTGFCNKTWDGAQWMGDACDITNTMLYTASSRSAVIQMIDDGTVMPVAGCGHGQYCYRIS